MAIATAGVAVHAEGSTTPEVSLAFVPSTTFVRSGGADGGMRDPFANSRLPSFYEPTSRFLQVRVGIFTPR